MCDEWLNNFMSFYDWAINNGYEDDLSIDRIDVNGNYEPSNCRWATQIEQANNTTRSHYLEYNGERHTIAEWSRITNIPQSTIKMRIKRNCEIEKILLKRGGKKYNVKQNL